MLVRRRQCADRLLGARPSVLDAVAIEAIQSGVPAGLGVQELTYVGVGKLFGMPAHISLALSLVRRTRDILIGAPALLAWQMLEATNPPNNANTSYSAQ